MTDIADKLRKARDLFLMFDPRALTINENTGHPDLCHVIVDTRLWTDFCKQWGALADLPDPNAVGSIHRRILSTLREFYSSRQDEAEKAMALGALLGEARELAKLEEKKP